MEKWPPIYDASYHPEPDSEYWFAEIETMDPEQGEQTIILPKLQQQLIYAYAHSGLYRQKWDAAGVNPEDIRSLDDFEALPILTKDDLRADQAEPLPEVPAEQIPVLQEDLANRLRAKGLRTIVKMMDSGSLERTEFKAKRIVDERSLYDEITDQAKG